MDSVNLEDSTTLISPICDHLCDNYNILCGFNLVDYDEDMQVLKQELSVFENYEFAPDQRIVFTLYDLDYYYLDCKVGFTVKNLIQLLCDLNIELSYCVLFTNHIGLKEKIQHTCKSFYKTNSLKIFENNYTNKTCLIDYIESDKNASNIKYHFCFLSNARRNHRILTRSFLKSKNLDQKTLLAWHHSPHRSSSNNNKISSGVSSSGVAKSDFIYVEPRIRMNDKFYTDCNNLKQLYNNNELLSKSDINKEIEFKPGENNMHAKFLDLCFVNIVTESTFDYPYPYVTEKTFKCFWHKIPFIIVGAPGILQHLHSLGFKTFNNFWDESYDLETDNSVRITKVFDIIEMVSKWSLDECKVAYNNMIDIIEHNYDHYFKNYVGLDLQNFLDTADF